MKDSQGRWACPERFSAHQTDHQASSPSAVFQTPYPERHRDENRSYARVSTGTKITFRINPTEEKV